MTQKVGSIMMITAKELCFLLKRFNWFIWFCLGAKFELFSQTSSSEGSNERKRQSTTPNSRSESPKISDCGAINLVVHKRRPPPILEESDQTVPSCPNTNASSSSKSDSTKTSPDPSKSGLKSEVKILSRNVQWQKMSLGGARKLTLVIYIYGVLDLSSTQFWRIGLSLGGYPTTTRTLPSESWISVRWFLFLTSRKSDLNFN